VALKDEAADAWTGQPDDIMSGPDRPVLQTDEAPEFWQFLNGLRGDDLLVELIVNELDAKSRRTEIRFEPEMLTAAGSGDQVDEIGWRRLSYLKGAGHKVPAKIGMFGVKNHGLKACFTLGNSITLRSGGLQIRQTLFGHGEKAPPYPAVLLPVREDPDAPAIGTRIEVPYRRSKLSVPHGEAISFAAITDEQVEGIFQQAAASLPKRLLGIMRPGMLERYELVLSHHRLGTRTFRFTAGRVRRELGYVTFFRQCEEVLEGGDELLEREHACLALSSVKSPDKARFFQAAEYRAAGKRLFAKEGLLVEVAWDVNVTGKLQIGEGRLRYPIAYPGSGEGSLSGTAAHYSGPFVSDTERHELAAQSGAWNDGIVRDADKLLSDLLAKALIPKFGVRALEIIAALQLDRLTVFAHRLLAARAFPSVDAKGDRVAHKRGSKLVIPVYENATSNWSAALAKVAPAALPIVHPKTPPALIELLASSACGGWLNSHRRFDGSDVLDRLQTWQSEFFPWRSEAEWRRTLSKPGVARDQLDALCPYPDTFSTDTRPSKESVHLPDTDGRLFPLSELRKGASIPADLQLDVPPSIHVDLKNHPVFRLSGWHLEGYALRDLLRDGRLENRPAAVRKRFFEWLAGHGEELGRADWPVVKDLPIWPSVNGGLHPFEALCLLDAKMARLLGAHIAKPTREVRALCAKSRTGRVRLVLRDEPRERGDHPLL
jgi:hypothetical protein